MGLSWKMHLMVGDVCQDGKRVCSEAVHSSATRPRQAGTVCFMIGVNQECER